MEEIKTVNDQELLDKWKNEHPEPEPKEPEPTTDEVLNALIGYDAGGSVTTNEEEAAK